jgi:hypothetical protein
MSRKDWAELNPEEKENQRARNRKHYRAHPEKMKARRIESQIKNAALVDSFKTKCIRCGNADQRVLDFHHLHDKDKGVATLRVAGYSKARILKEISKCVVLCANCHRIQHWEERHGLGV